MTRRPKKSANRGRSRSSGSTSQPTSQPRFSATANVAKNWGGDGTLIAPDSVRVTLPYTEVLLPTTTVGSLYWYVFRGNGVFDPNYTGTGAQPAGFDQWAFLYGSYVVLSSKIFLEIINGSGLTVETAILPSYSSGALATASDAASSRFARSCVTSGIGNAALSRLSNSMSTSQIFGISPAAVTSDDLYSALVTANVANAQTWFWCIAHQNISSSATLATMLRVRIEYDVKFFDATTISLSAVRLHPTIRPLAGSDITQGDSSSAAAPSGTSMTTVPCSLLSSSSLPTVPTHEGASSLQKNAPQMDSGFDGPLPEPKCVICQRSEDYRFVVGSKLTICAECAKHSFCTMGGP